MEGFTLTAVLGIALVMFACGAGVGFMVSYARQQSATGGRAPAELAKELDEYKGRVNDHFEKSAELFHGLSVQYRDLYRHMAETARDLVDEDAQQATALAFSQAALLAADADDESTGDTEAGGGDDEHLAEATFTLDPDDGSEDTTVRAATIGDSAPAADEDDDTSVADSEPDTDDETGSVALADAGEEQEEDEDVTVRA